MPAEERKKACSLRIEGRVQGVGFRYSALHAARRYGVRGWVKNEYDGSVTAYCEGDESSVELFIDWCRKGPPGALVTSLDISPATYQNRYSSFSIAH
jgi:acylphosphatase